MKLKPDVVGITQTLRNLTAVAWRGRLSQNVYKLARHITDREASCQAKVGALVDELHQHAQYIPSPADTGMFVPWSADPGPTPPDPTSRCMIPFDADYACLFVATLAMSVGIRCRFVGVRYDQSWTCWVSYEVGDHWDTIDPLRQRPERDPDERVVGPVPGLP
jgi:hypothetical protein